MLIKSREVRSQTYDAKVSSINDRWNILYYSSVTSHLPFIVDQPIYAMISTDQCNCVYTSSFPRPSVQPEALLYYATQSTSVDSTGSTYTSTSSVWCFSALDAADHRLISPQNTSETSTATELLDRDLRVHTTLCRRIRAFLLRKIREHHRSVNAAFNLQYGSITTDGTSCGATRAAGRLSWGHSEEGFKNGLARYHREINGAYQTYYAAVKGRNTNSREMQWTDSKVDDRAPKASVQGDNTGIQWGKRDGWEYSYLD